MNISFGKKTQEIKIKLQKTEEALKATEEALKATEKELKAAKEELLQFKQKPETPHDVKSVIERWKKQNSADFQEEVEATQAEVDSYYGAVEAALTDFFNENEDTVKEIWLVPATGLLKVSFVKSKKPQRFIWRPNSGKEFRGKGIEKKLLALGWRKETFTQTDGTKFNWFCLEMAP